MGKDHSTSSGNTNRLRGGESRRKLIFKSLHDCMIEKGYIKTTLADIALNAEMSASHLLYYFDGKEDILEQYFDHVAVRFVQKLEEFSQLPADEQIEGFSDWWFSNEFGATHEIGFMLECFGAAVHDGVLKVTKSDFDRQCKLYLQKLFQTSGKHSVDESRDLAEISYSMMIGLRSAVYFDECVTLDRACDLFKTTMVKMYG